MRSFANLARALQQMAILADLRATQHADEAAARDAQYEEMANAISDYPTGLDLVRSRAEERRQRSVNFMQRGELE